MRPFIRKKLLIPGFLILCAAVFSQVSLASPEAIAQINKAVENHLFEIHENSQRESHRLEVKVGYIDPRMNLPVCPNELSAELNGNSRGVGKVQVKITCSGPRPWSKFIPAEVNIYTEVAVAASNLRRGEIIGAQHIIISEVNLSELRRTPIFEAQPLIGMELKYPLTSGAAYSLDIVKAPIVIERGDIVQMIAKAANLEIKQQGEALQDGAIGNVISVKNNSSKMVVQATIVSTGRVEIQL